MLLLLAAVGSAVPLLGARGARHNTGAAAGAEGSALAASADGSTHTHAGTYSHAHAHTHADGLTHTHSHTHEYAFVHSHRSDSAGGTGAGVAPGGADSALEGARGSQDGAAGTVEALVHVHDDGTVHTHGAGAPDTWTVEYTRQGVFVPERLDIATGDTVVFVNTSDVPVWPASNIHPTHEILPDFDPLEVIWPGESWSHAFNRNGYWRYHNHIEASQTGLIVAQGGPEEDLAPLLANAPRPEFPPARPSAGGEELFDDVAALRRFVETYGPANAVAALKTVELQTGRYCHDAAHEAGRVAYEIFGPIAFAISGHDCQAGALHGATEALFAERGTSRLGDDVTALCSSTLNPFVRHQCYHGVGHGLMAWTSYEIHEALGFCDVIDTEADAASCYSGVFMENVVGGLSGAMGHETQYLRDDDPHFPCDIVADRYRADCYYYQTTHMRRVFDGDLASVARECATLRDEARRLCFSSYGRDVGNLTRGQPAEAVSLCGHAPAGLDRVECLSGAAQDRFWETTGADEAISMCALLDVASEADACWWTIIDRAGDVFIDEAGRRSFCDRVPADRRGLCASEVLA